jgi:hypothetical protein
LDTAQEETVMIPNLMPILSNSEPVLEAYLAPAGFSEREIVKVLAHVSLNTLGFFNRLAGTTLDFPSAPEI